MELEQLAKRDCRGAGCCSVCRSGCQEHAVPADGGSSRVSCTPGTGGCAGILTTTKMIQSFCSKGEAASCSCHYSPKKLERTSDKYGCTLGKS